MKTLPSAALYLSDGKAVISPRHANGDGGFLYEQKTPTVLTNYSAEELGAAVKSALREFSIREVNLRGYKKTDWPAFQASGSKTVKSFEKEFLAISVSFLNASGALARAQTTIEEDSSLALSVVFNPLSPDSDIGNCLEKLASKLRQFLRSQEIMPR